MSEQEFNKAQKDVHTLKTRPSNDELLKLYAYFKQATTGDVTGKRPGLLNLKERAKFDAWEKVKGLTAAEAKSQYIQVVTSLIAADSK